MRSSSNTRGSRAERGAIPVEERAFTRSHNHRSHPLLRLANPLRITPLPSEVPAFVVQILILQAVETNNMKASHEMTVKELIEQLMNLPEDAEVRIQQPAHDYWHTTTTTEVSTVDMDTLKWSGYHATFVIPTTSDEHCDEETDDNTLTAVVLG